MLTSAEFTAKHIHTTAKIQFEERDGGWSIHTIDASVSDITAAACEEQAQSGRKNCPLSQVPSGVDIHLLARSVC
jgi:organic hydroperoxide reductase OsmC/OhrA